MTHPTQTHHFKYGNKEREYIEYTSLLAVLGADITTPGEVFLDDSGWESFRHSGWRFFPRKTAPTGKETALIVRGPSLYLFPNKLAGAFEPGTLARVTTEFGLEITSRLFGDIVTLARVDGDVTQMIATVKAIQPLPGCRFVEPVFHEVMGHR